MYLTKQPFSAPRNVGCQLFSVSVVYREGEDLVYRYISYIEVSVYNSTVGVGNPPEIYVWVVLLMLGGDACLSW